MILTNFAGSVLLMGLFQILYPYSAQTRASIVTEFAAILGMVLGTVGFVMSVMNYLRDRPKIKAFVNWHMEELRTEEKMGIVTVANVGRRPIFISTAVMLVPKGFGKCTHFILMESVRGQKLSEGDAPTRIKVNHEGMEQYAKVWRKVRVYVEDSAGRKYFAKPDPRKPPWAK